MTAIRRPTPPPRRHPYRQWSPDAAALVILGEKWTPLIIRVLAHGPQRFVTIQRRLSGISTEQLRSRLNRMVEDGLLRRQRYREVPPRVDYELTQKGLDALPLIEAAARWGWRHAWDEPRRDQEVHIPAIFELCASMWPRTSKTVGIVELVILGNGVPGDFYTLALSRTGAVLTEGRPERQPAVSIRGNESAWALALGPYRNASSLALEGDSNLALTVLAFLAGGELNPGVMTYAA